ncbi:MAG: orotidine-5'-phosphate decarboxylase [Solirubrobacteraceae bacterium]|nr:orotidine-5'-phosphate decarboxylase [Solirubrobacteraceae bacterium]
MSTRVSSPPFGDRLAAAADRRGTPLVLGLDPDPARLWPGITPSGDDPAATSLGLQAALAHEGTRPGALAALAVYEHCRQVIEATAHSCVAVKLQVASFERLGPAGWQTLHAVAQLVRDADLLLIADAKRGDIDVTAESYAAALFDGTETPWGWVPGLGADAVTVNPLMGHDAIQPFLDRARAVGGGIFVLVRTSNPGAADFQEQRLASGEPLWQRIAGQVAALDSGKGALADAGAVCGATVPERVAELRQLMPRAPFLLPGVGAQGGTIDGLRAAFAPGLGGGLVTVSRGLVRAHETSGDHDAAAAAASAARDLRDQCLRAAA